MIIKDFKNTWSTPQKSGFQLPLSAIRVLGAFLFLNILTLNNIAAECTMICRSSLNLSLPANGVSTIAPEILLANPSCNPVDFYVEITNEQGIMIGNTITCNELGQTLNAGVFNTETGESCWTTIEVFDYFNPQIVCQDTIISCMSDYSVAAIGQPTVTDNCTITSFTHTDVFTPAECFTENINGDTITATVERTWTATDESGNAAICTQYIYLKRATVNDVVFPQNMDGIVLPAIDCAADPTDLTLTGEPTIEGHPILTGGHCELITTYSDFSIDICGGSRRILRTWRVVDYCNGHFKEHIQILKLTDTTAPEISCLSDFEVNTDSYSCYATVTLPETSAIENCSELTITPSWSFGSGYGPFNDIPVGAHIVTYVAEDACGNSSSCTMTVTVIDEVVPAMVCEGHTQVTLDSEGTAFVDAAAFDDGSYDNCAIDRFEVSRDGLPFLAYGAFDCNDIGQSVLVTLRAYDIYGNYNSCDLLVEVKDETKPVISCPVSVTLECFDNVDNLVLTGEPIVLDACGVDTVYYSDDVQLNNCHVGRVVRLWTAEDIHGNTKSCVQQIFIEDTDSLEISFPANYETFDCNADLSEEVTGVPVLAGRNCKDVSVTSNDQVLPISIPACYRILRKWTVVNWCVFDPNSGSDEGYYEYTQVLTVSDTVAPELVIFGDTIVGTFSQDCNGGMVHFSDVVANDCSNSINVTNNSPYADENGANASGVYPLGTHEVIFTAEDGCGNVTNKSVTITVVDEQAPSAYCIGEISVSIDNQGVAIITKEMVDLGSTDNCTDASLLNISLSQDTFTCDDQGINEVTMTVEDEFGNSSACTVMVNVQNNNGFCAPEAVELSGQILKENGTPVEGFLVRLSGDQIDSTLTDVNGNYKFENLPVGGNYEVKPENNERIIEGVTTLDLLYVKRYVLGIGDIVSPYRKIAVDVNNSKSISSLDMISVRRALLEVDQVYQRVDSWKFIDAHFDFSNEPNPMAAPYQESFVVENLASSIDTLDFFAIKMGDANDNASSQLLAGGEERSVEESVAIVLENRKVKEGETYRVPFQMETLDDVFGVQFELGLNDKIEIVDLEIAPAGLALGWETSNLNRSKSENELAVSWISKTGEKQIFDAPIFYLTISAKANLTLEEAIFIKNDGLKPEIYQGENFESLETADISIKYPEKTVEAEDLVQKPVEITAFPNPTIDEINFSFNMKEASEIQVSIYGESGQLISSSVAEMEAGDHVYQLVRNDLGQGVGLRFYTIYIAATNETITGRFHVIR